MTFIQKTRVKLIIYYIPIVEWLFAGVIIIFAFHHFIDSSSVARLNCERNESNRGICQLRKSFSSRYTFSLTAFIAADIETKYETDRHSGKYFVYRISLITTDKIFPLTERYERNETKIREIVNQINYFLKHSEQESLFVIQGADRSGTAIALVILIGSLIFVLAWAKMWKVTCHRFLKRIDIEQKSIIGAKFISTVDCSEILSVGLEIVPPAFFRERYETYQIVIVTKTGHYVSIFPKTTMLWWKKRYEKISNQINRFLNLS